MRRLNRRLHSSVAALPRFIIRDDFNDTLGVGAVDGTLSTPGPGSRNTVENDGTYSVGGGSLIYTAQATPIWGDNGIYYRLFPVDRIAGRLLAVGFTITTGGGGKYVAMGWNNVNDIAGDPAAWNGGMMRLNGTAIMAEGYTGVSYQVSIGAYTFPVFYRLVLVMRTNGMFWFIKGGLFTNWHLLWFANTNNQTPLYVAYSNYNTAGNVDSFRVPLGKWIPVPLGYDTFTRGNGPIGSTESTGPDNQILTPKAWVNDVGTWVVSGNAAGCSVLAGGLGVCTITGEPDLIVEAGVTRTAGAGGVVARYNDASNYIFAYHDGVNAVLTKRVAGVNTVVITAVAAYVAGAVLRVILSGTAVSLYYNGNQIGTTQTVPELVNYKSCGLYANNTNPKMDNFTVFPRGTNGEYEALTSLTA